MVPLFGRQGGMGRELLRWKYLKPSATPRS